MKEFLLKTDDGYKLITAENAECEGVIKVPDGAEILAETMSGNIFYKPAEFNRFNYSFIGDSVEWSETFTNPYDEIGSFVKSILWQRESLNEKVASAEAYRQAEVLPFIDDEPKEKHSHYKKDISHLNILDVYRVLELFEVDSPCLQHAIKKLLCAGQRGAKDTEKDIQEAIDTLIRYKQMREEDDNS